MVCYGIVWLLEEGDYMMDLKAVVSVIELYHGAHSFMHTYLYVGEAQPKAELCDASSVQMTCTGLHNLSDVCIK